MLIRREHHLEVLGKLRDNFPKYLVTTDPGNVVVEGIHRVNIVDWLKGSVQD